MKDTESMMQSLGVGQFKLIYLYYDLMTSREYTNFCKLSLENFNFMKIIFNWMNAPAENSQSLLDFLKSYQLSAVYCFVCTLQHI